jgi:hypothetical protein
VRSPGGSSASRLDTIVGLPVNGAIGVAQVVQPFVTHRATQQTETGGRRVATLSPRGQLGVHPPHNLFRSGAVWPGQQPGVGTELANRGAIAVEEAVTCGDIPLVHDSDTSWLPRFMLAGYHTVTTP